MSDKQRVEEAIEKNKDNMLDILADLVEKRSTPGNEKTAQKVVIKKLESLGLEVDVWEPDVDSLREHPAFFETNAYVDHGYKGRPNVAAVHKGTNSDSSQSLCLSGHIDVVPADPIQAWNTDPWDPVIENGKMFGRGTYDMKGGIAGFLHAFETLKELDVEIEGDLILQTTIEEEAGGIGGVLSALERGYQPDAAIVGEPAGPPIIGIASAGVMYFRITVPGKSAHTARKFLGVDAVNKAYKIYNKLEKLDRERKKRTPDYPPALNRTPEAKGNMTNLSISSFNAGKWSSTVPGEAVLEYRIGWPPNTNESKGDVRNEIKHAIDSVVENDAWLSEHPPQIDWFGWQTNPHEVDTDEEFVQTVAGNAEKVTGRKHQFRGGLGGNDERFYNRYYNIPAISLGPAGGRGHGPDEYVEIESLLDASKVYATSIIDWCNTSK